MNSVSIIAIDPGSAGGIATYLNGVDAAYPMPDTEKDTLDLLRNCISLARQAKQEPMCMIEKVGGFIGGAGNPGSTMFNFGRGVGFVYGVLMSHEVRIEEATPQKWQKALALGTKETVRAPFGCSADERKRIGAQNARLKTEWKNKLKARAQQLYPKLKITLKTSDALLILEYAKHGTVFPF